MRKPNVQEIRNKFKRRIARKSWSFEGRRSTNNFTHGYHRYPAKFLPDLVKKLIESYTEPNDIIVDLFAGCGTTLVEGKLHGRTTKGVDINPVAELIAKAKINQIKPNLLETEYQVLTTKILEYSSRNKYYENHHPRIDYWFTRTNKNKIAFLYSHILNIGNNRVKDFFLCCLSHILKNCSRWLQDGTKPQKDPNKKNHDVFAEFARHSKIMMRQNQIYYTHIKNNKLSKTTCSIRLADARKTGYRSGSINAIITSPPYVTSYEYADIHQLTAYWYEYMTEINSFRKKFIGTFFSLNKNQTVSPFCPSAKKIVSELKKVDTRSACETANYFRDMLRVANEMYRILADNGVVCLVIGNTELKGVKIESAEVFAEMLYAVGFTIEDVIKRSISNKIIPTIRDKKSGRFTTLKHENKKFVYPEEYIIIARKQ